MVRLMELVTPSTTNSTSRITNSQPRNCNILIALGISTFATKNLEKAMAPTQVQQFHNIMGLPITWWICLDSIIQVQPTEWWIIQHYHWIWMDKWQVEFMATTPQWECKSITTCRISKDSGFLMLNPTWCKTIWWAITTPCITSTKWDISTTSKWTWTITTISTTWCLETMFSLILAIWTKTT